MANQSSIKKSKPTSSKSISRSRSVTSQTDSPRTSQKEDLNLSKTDHWDVGRIFWGLLFVLVGGLILLSNFGLTKVNWVNLWRLWPLTIIFAGLSMISIRSWLWRLLTFGLVILALLAVTWVTVGNYAETNPSRSESVASSKLSDDIKRADISIKAGASRLRITSSDMTDIAKVKLDSNLAILNVSTSRDGDTQRLSYSSKNDANCWMCDVHNQWLVNLTRQLPITLRVDSGASDIDIDISEAIVPTTDIMAGASSIKLKLGDKADFSDVSIDSGASSIVIRLPQSLGVQLKLDSGLTAKNLADLNDKGDNNYESKDYSQATKKVKITGKTGAASLTIERY